MSGGEPSSIKRPPRCAVGAPVPNGIYGAHVKVRFEDGVYGLILRLILFLRSYSVKVHLPVRLVYPLTQAKTLSDQGSDPRSGRVFQ